MSNHATTVFVGIMGALAFMALGYLVFSANSNPPKPGEYPSTPAYTNLWIDKETGCHYFVANYNVWPRLNKFGQPMCGPGQE